MAGAKSEPSKPAPRSAAPAGPVDAATAEQTSDYTRRAGGWVLTDRGWVLEDKAAGADRATDKE